MKKKNDINGALWAAMDYLTYEFPKADPQELYDELIDIDYETGIVTARCIPKTMSKYKRFRKLLVDMTFK